MWWSCMRGRRRNMSDAVNWSTWTRADVRKLCVRWNDSGVVGTSEHANARLLVRYLRLLYVLGDDVTVLWVQ